ncbi:MAG: hypothetical protein AB7O44_26420 [Hyphomicrobiaceae bacterium]
MAIRPSAGGPFILAPRDGAAAPSGRKAADAAEVSGPAEAAVPAPGAPTDDPAAVLAEATRITAEAAQEAMPADAADLIGAAVEVPPAAAASNAAEPADGTTGEPAQAARGAAVVPTISAAEGKAIVPPPDPAGLIAAVPEREPTFEEFATEYEARRTPEESRPEAARLAAELRAEVELRKADILATAEARKAEIAAVAEAQMAAIAASAEAQAVAIRQSFAAARSELIAGAETQKAALAAQTAADTTLVTSGTAAMIAEMDGHISQRQSDLTTFAAAQSREPEAIARAEEVRANSELETAAQEAERRAQVVARRYPGSENPAPDQRAAALEVGRRSADDIREKKAAIGDALREKAAEFSDRFDGFAQETNAQLEQSRPAIVATLEDGGAGATAALERGRAAAAEALGRRLQADLAALEVGEANAIARIEAAREPATAEVQAAAVEASGEIDAQAAAIATEMDATAQEAEAVVGAEDEPYLPGIADVVAAARGAISKIHTTGAAQLSASAAARVDMLADVAASVAEGFASIAESAWAIAKGAVQRAGEAASQTMAGNAEQGRQTIATLSEQQQGFRTETLAQIDANVERARSEMTLTNDGVRADMRGATEEAITEAVKPLTDDAGTRAEAAAQDAGASWWEGLLTAIGELVLGFLIFVAVALVVAFVFGLTLGAAMLVVGAAFLVYSAISAYQTRSVQLAQMGIEAGPGFLVLLALSDATGITFIAESFTGADIVTGEQLSAGEQVRRGVIGWVTAIGIVFGARAAMKGPPGGWARPTSIFRGWRNFSWKAFTENARGLWGEIRNGAVGLYKAAREGITRVREWAARWGRRGEPEAPEVAPAPPEQPSGDVAPLPEDQGGGSVGAARFSKIQHVEGLRTRLAELQELAETLPEGSARRAELLAEANRLMPEADRLAGRARAVPDEASLNSEQTAIEQLEQRIGELETQVDTEIVRLDFDPEAALLERQARGFRHRFRQMEAAAESLPEGTNKVIVKQRLRTLKGDVEAIDALLRENPQDILPLRDDIVTTERGLADLSSDIEALQPGSGAVDFNPREFAERVRRLPVNERVALVESTAQRFANRYGWEYDGRLSKLNDRSIYRAPSGELYSVDTQHGTFERCSPSGKHLGEYNFQLDQIDPADPSGDHDLRVR